MPAPSDPPPQEFERKFLVTDPSVVDGLPATAMRQGYLFGAAGYALRIRLTESPDGSSSAVLTLKGPRTGLGRPEAEWEVPLEHGRALFERATASLEKRRHLVTEDGLVWEVDVFEGPHAGLVLAEVEAAEDVVAAAVAPAWAGDEVTEDPRYTNQALAEAGRPPPG